MDFSNPKVGCGILPKVKQEDFRKVGLTAVVEGETSNGQTIRTIARKADVRQDRALPENGTLQPEADRNSRFKHYTLRNWSLSGA